MTTITAAPTRLATRLSGADPRTYVIAELSANHHQSIDEALRLVDAAAATGADAVKLQTFTADTITLDCRTEPFMVGGGATPWEGRNLHEIYDEAHTPWEWHAELFARARHHGLDVFSSPFDVSAVAFLESLEPAAHKVASFELVDIGLIEAIARTGRPAIMSTGMATLPEIEEAVAAFRNAGGRELVLLKCTSAYPSPAGDMNLRTIADLAARFDVIVGLSDHSMDLAVPVTAVALGARVIEKHLTLSRDVPGPDSAFSLEPHEFTAMVLAVRTAEAAMGSVRYAPTPKEAALRRYRRSLFAARDIAAGELFTPVNVRSVRPGDGLHTRYLPLVLGTRAAMAVPFGVPLTADHLAPPLRQEVRP